MFKARPEHYVNPPRAVLWVLRVAIALAALAVASIPVAIYMSMPL